MQQVLLDAVEGAPEVTAPVIGAARLVELLRGDGAVFVGGVAQRQGGVDEGVLLPQVEVDALHHVFARLDLRELADDAVRPFNDIGQDVASVADTQVFHGVAADQAVVADKAETAREHLVTGRAVMGVDQNDLIGGVAVDLPLVAETQQVLGVVGLAFGAGLGLADHERHEAFAAQAVDDVGGGDVGVTGRTRAVRRVGEHRGGGTEDLFVGQRAFRTDQAGDVLERGG